MVQNEQGKVVVVNGLLCVAFSLFILGCGRKSKDFPEYIKAA